MTERPRRRRRGLRVRMVTAAVALLAVSFAVSIALARQMLLGRVDRAIERELAQEVEELRAVTSAADPTDTSADVAALFTRFLEGNVPADDEAFYTFVDGRPHLASFGADRDLVSDDALVTRWTTTTDTRREDLVVASRPLKVLVAPVLDVDDTVRGTFVVAIDPQRDRDDVDDVVRTLVLVTVVVLVAGAVASWSLASRVLRPVRDLTVAARATGAGDLQRRIETDGDDELTELGDTYNAMLDRLERSFHEQRAFLDDVAHELRTPITIVRGHLELMPTDDPDAEQSVELMTDELDRMSRYVDDLLLVAKSRRPDFLRLELVDVADIVDGALQRGAAMADRRWTRGPTPPLGTVLTEADPDRLMQAVLALVTNAVQHTVDGDLITIGAERRTERPPRPPHPPNAHHARDAPDPPAAPFDEIVFAVSDTGPGIAEADLARIFQRFSRGPSSARSRPEGTGLGLAIVDAIAVAHRGRTSVTSTPRAADSPDTPSGSTFRLHLPHTLAEDPT